MKVRFTIYSQPVYIRNSMLGYPQSVLRLSKFVLVFRYIYTSILHIEFRISEKQDIHKLNYGYPKIPFQDIHNEYWLSKNRSVDSHNSRFGYGYPKFAFGYPKIISIFNIIKQPNRGNKQ